MIEQSENRELSSNDPADQDSSNDTSQKNRPRKRSFSLKFLLVVITGVCIWLTVHADRARKQKQAVEAIVNYGGWAYYDYSYPTSQYDHTGNPDQESPVPEFLLESLGVDFFHSVVTANFVVDSTKGRLENPNGAPAPLDQLLNCPNIRTIYLKDRQVDDDGLRIVGKLKKLHTLYIWDGYDITDEGVSHLQNLSLEDVHLTTAEIGDESLKVFGNMPKMKSLSLQFNEFSDAGILNLTKLKELESLWICGVSAQDGMHNPDVGSPSSNDKGNTPITDKTLKTVLQFPKLKELAIQNSVFTDAAVNNFKKARPGCKIYVTDGLILDTDSDHETK